MVKGDRRTSTRLVPIRASGNDRHVQPIPSPTALITWSHSEAGWGPEQQEARRDQVARLATALRSMGIDIDLDLYHYDEGPDWSRWGPIAVRDSDYVLVVVTPAWRLRWEGRGDATIGTGVAAETDVLRTLYAENRDLFHRKVRLLFLPGDDPSQVPDGLSGPARYILSGTSTDDLHDLVRDLTGQAAYPRPPLGEVPVLPPRLDPTATPSAGDAAERSRLHAALHALPDPEPGEGPHLPWWRARERVLSALADLDSQPVPPTVSAATAAPAHMAAPTHSLTYGPLPTAPDVPWRDQWDPSRGHSSAAITVHAIPVPPRPVPARLLAQLAHDLPAAIRRSDLIPATAGLGVHDDPDGVTVLIQPPDEPRGWRDPDPGRPVGVRAHAQGAVSAWHTLPTDNMGPALDPRTVPDLIAGCLRLCGAAARPADQVALAVELGPNTLVSVIRGGEFGNRSSASLGMRRDATVIVRPDETVDSTALAGNARPQPPRSPPPSCAPSITAEHDPVAPPLTCDDAPSPCKNTSQPMQGPKQVASSPPLTWANARRQAFTDV